MSPALSVPDPAWEPHFSLETRNTAPLGGGANSSREQGWHQERCVLNPHMSHSGVHFSGQSTA